MVSNPLVTSLQELQDRLEKLEETRNDEVLTLIEILSNLSFFGEINKAQCQYFKDGQCAYFVVAKEHKNKLPTVSKCRVNGCNKLLEHYHIETSNITCSICQQSRE
jgi:hypothetical protein